MRYQEDHQNKDRYLITSDCRGLRTKRMKRLQKIRQWRKARARAQDMSLADVGGLETLDGRTRIMKNGPGTTGDAI